MSVDLQAFMSLVEKADDRCVLRLAGSEVRRIGRWRSLFSGKASLADGHARVRTALLQSLVAAYGEGLAGRTGMELVASENLHEPLTVGMVENAVAEAERLRRLLDDFTFGVDASGETVSGSLDQALNSWFAAHPPTPELTLDERSRLKWHIRDELAAGRPFWNSRRDLFDAVQGGWVDPFHELRALEAEHLQATRLRAAIRELPESEGVHLESFDIELLQSEIRARLAERTRGGLLPLPDAAARLDWVVTVRAAVLQGFLRGVRRVGESGLPEEWRTLLRGMLFDVSGSTPRLLDEADIVRLIETRRILLANAELSRRFSERLAPLSPFNQALLGALAGKRLSDLMTPSPVSARQRDAGGERVRVRVRVPCNNGRGDQFLEPSEAVLDDLADRIRRGIDGGLVQVSMPEANRILAATMVLWADGLAVARQAEKREVVAYLMTKRLTEPTPIGGEYVRGLLAHPLALDCEMMAPAFSGPLLLDAWRLCLDALAQAAAANYAAVLAEIGEEESGLPDDHLEESLALALLALNFSSDEMRRLFERLEAVQSEAFRARLLSRRRLDHTLDTRLKTHAALCKALVWRLGLNLAPEE